MRYPFKYNVEILKIPVSIMKYYFQIIFQKLGTNYWEFSA